MLLIAIVDQRVETFNRLHDDIAAAPAIAAPGPAELDEFLAAEGDATIAALARLDIDLATI
jgi:hypothetical protein